MIIPIISSIFGSAYAPMQTCQHNYVLYVFNLRYSQPFNLFTTIKTNPIYKGTVNNYSPFSAVHNDNTQLNNFCPKVSILWLLYCICIGQVRVLYFVLQWGLCYAGLMTALSPIWMTGVTPTQIIRNFLLETGNIQL